MELAVLNLSGLDDANWQPWLRAVLPPDIGWQAAAALPTGGRAVLIYDAPDAYFVRAMRAGVPFAEMIAGWQDQAKRSLAIWRKARRQVFLIDADAFAAASGALADRLTGWLGCAVAAVPAPDPAAGAVDPYDVLAAHAARSLAPVRQLADELEAGGLSPRLAGSASQDQLGAAYDALQAQTRETEAAEQADTLRAELASVQALFHEEVALLQQQLMTAQQALEQEYRDRIAQRDTAAADLWKLRTEAEQEQLRLTTALQEQACQLAALLDRRRELLGELNRSRDEIDALFTSTSWRVTAPLRRARLAVAKPA